MIRVFLLVLLLVSIGGCAAQSKTGYQAKPEFDYTTIAQGHNARVAGLERVWARATVQVSTVDEDGKSVREQGEGHLQIVQPDRLALTVGKVGQVMFYLGSNDESYWWIDLSNDDARHAAVGTHAAATPDKARRFGVPVHPLDLIELFAIAPLPEGPFPVYASGEHPRVELPLRWGTRLVEFDRETLEPRSVTLLDRDGQVQAVAVLSRYEIVRIEGDATRRPRAPSRVEIKLPGVQTDVRLTLNEPRNKPIRGIAFDLEKLLGAYRVEDVQDLDSTTRVEFGAVIE